MSAVPVSFFARPLKLRMAGRDVPPSTSGTTSARSDASAANHTFDHLSLGACGVRRVRGVRHRVVRFYLLADRRLFDRTIRQNDREAIELHHGLAQRAPADSDR